MNAEKYCKSLDVIKSPSLSTSKFTQSHAATAELRRSPVASSDGMTELEMITDSASTNAAGYQRSNPANHPESTMNIASSAARSTPSSCKANTKASKTNSGKSSSLGVSMQTTDEALIAAQTCKIASNHSGISAPYTGDRSNVEQISEALPRDERTKIYNDQLYCRQSVSDVFFCFVFFLCGLILTLSHSPLLSTPDREPPRHMCPSQFSVKTPQPLGPCHPRREIC